MNLRHQLQLSLARERIRLLVEDINEAWKEMDEVLLRIASEDTATGDRGNGDACGAGSGDHGDRGCGCGDVGVVRLDSVRVKR